MNLTLVRIYLSDGRHEVRQVIKWLEQNKIRFTVFRGIAGLGSDGLVHKASLLDLSSDLPMVIELFDKPEQINDIINTIKTLVEADHIVSWPVQSGI
jgi:PII-like signaling protein|tara:strand:- start:1836 stop:2126 length:291 start_codon:yes stop_codon:yes gene_type:complete